MRKKIYYAACMLSSGLLFSQQISVTDVARNSRFNQFIEEGNNGPRKLSYADINGTPYYYTKFEKATESGAEAEIISIRYNSFLDTVELLNEDTVYEIPKDKTGLHFKFLKTSEKLINLGSSGGPQGYFFEIAGGENKILKKIATSYYRGKVSLNPMIPDDPARFISEKPKYFLWLNGKLMEMPTQAKDLAKLFPTRQSEISEFLSSRKIRLKNEGDLAKLAPLLNPQ